MCAIHSFALRASDAVLPLFQESLLKDLTSYFSRRTNCLNDLAMTQGLSQVVHHRVQKYIIFQRRRHINDLEQHEALFKSHWKPGAVKRVHKIHENIAICGTKLMLCCLKLTSRKVYAFKLEFQSQQYRLHQLHRVVSAEYKIILSISSMKMF